MGNHKRWLSSLLKCSFVLALLLIAAADSSAQSTVPHWISAPTEEETEGTRFFRHTFALDTRPSSGTIKVCSREESQVFVNGYCVGTTTTHYVPVTYHLATGLRAGENLIAVAVRNSAALPALIVEAHYYDGDTEPITVVTDEAWRVSSVGADGWSALAFDDEHWRHAVAGSSDPGFGPTLTAREEAFRLEHEASPLTLPWRKPEPARFAGQTFRSNSDVFKDVYELRRTLLALHDMNFNLICIDIPWGAVEVEPDVFDFAWFDIRVQEIVRAGFWLQVKLNVLGGTWGHPQWIAKEERFFKRSPENEKDTNQTLTYASEELNQELAYFFRTVAEHYRDYPIVNYSPFVSISGEIEYHHGYYQDYSAPAEEAFRTWLAEHYGGIDALNSAWESEYATFSDISQPVPVDPVPKATFDFNPRVVDFFKYREDCLDAYARMFADALRVGDPGAKVALTVGHALSGECARRNTLSAFRWLRHADVLWVDPAPTDYHPIRIAVGRAATLMSKNFAVELDGLYAYVRDKVDANLAFPEQAKAAFEGGAPLLTAANWRFASYGPQGTEAEFFQYETAHRGMASAASPTCVPVLGPAKEAVYVSKWTMFTTHGNPAAWKAVQDAYQALYEREGRMVDIVTDDQFIPDPGVLKVYEHIHVPFAPVVSDVAMEGLRSCGVPLVADEAWGKYDEYGDVR